MNKFLLVLLLLTGLQHAAADSLPAYNPARIQVRDIYIGVVIKTPDGEYIEDGKDAAMAAQISNYLSEQLSAAGVNKGVYLEFYFPWGCGFNDAKATRFRPDDDETSRSRRKPGTVREVDLNILVVHTVDRLNALNTSINFCYYWPENSASSPTRFVWPEGLPKPKIDREYFNNIPENMSGQIMAWVGPYLDAVVFGAGRSASEMQTKER